MAGVAGGPVAGPFVDRAASHEPVRGRRSRGAVPLFSSFASRPVRTAMNMQAQVSAVEAPWGQARGMHARLPGEGRTVSDVHWDGRGRAGDRQRDAQDGRIDVGPPPPSCRRLAISSILHFELSSGSDAFLRLSSLQIAL